MEQLDANQLKKGMKLEVEGSPYNAVTVDLVKPGKGQAFTRVRMKNLLNGQVIERTFKSNEKVGLADIEEVCMRLIYKETDGAVFMDDKSFEQITLPMTLIGEDEVWLMEEQLYDIIFYKGQAVTFAPPNFMEMLITETDPGERGNTSGKVLKPAITETGAKVQVPIFVESGEKVRIDTRTGEYVNRV
jgi:elongation factor P